MSTTTAPAHTCHGRIFCGTPRTLAVAECPACHQPGCPALGPEEQTMVWDDETQRATFTLAKLECNCQGQA